ncbi:MAG: 2-amino-4-hydroxy-6-hydroxymethyldihydropteridine diphosphokinase [Burkholderiales bacterium]|nr:2-amino-4-hydroxy-6-hydroxymethyldihydropteridine diphosphokinase [Burkholderiales bacterium]
MQAAYIGIGANLGAARASVEQAILRLAALPQTRLCARSSLYGSAPVDAGGDDYVNAVALLETALDASALLHELQQIELAFGRARPYRNAPRTLDLDLLLYGEQQIASAELSVPHPRLSERAFVLLPLLELAPQLQIPGKGAAQAFVAAVAAQRIHRLA